MPKTLHQEKQAIKLLDQGWGSRGRPARRRFLDRETIDTGGDACSRRALRRDGRKARSACRWSCDGRAHFDFELQEIFFQFDPHFASFVCGLESTQS